MRREFALPGIVYMESLEGVLNQAVVEAHKRAEKETLTFLAKQSEPISPGELFGHVNKMIRSWELKLGSNQPTAQGSFWNLIDQGKLNFTPDRRVFALPEEKAKLL
jgi:hypothetical protein